MSLELSEKSQARHRETSITSLIQGSRKADLMDGQMDESGILLPGSWSKGGGRSNTTVPWEEEVLQGSCDAV